MDMGHVHEHEHEREFAHHLRVEVYHHFDERTEKLLDMLTDALSRLGVPPPCTIGPATTIVVTPENPQPN